MQMRCKRQVNELVNDSEVRWGAAGQEDVLSQCEAAAASGCRDGSEQDQTQIQMSI